MKKLSRIKRIINIALWTLIGSYLLLIISIQIPAVQRFIGNRIESTLSDKLGTEVKVGKVSFGFLNRLVIDDIVIKDQQHKKMLSASRLSAKLDLIALIKGTVDISSAQIFGLHATLYKKDAASQPNFQFMLDSLKSKDTDEEKKTEIHINSLVIRHGNIKYDQLDAPQTTGIFNPKHIHVNALSAHLTLDQLSDDSLSLKVKRLAFKEQAGLDVQNIIFKLSVANQDAKLRNLEIKLPHSHIQIPELTAQSLSSKKSFNGRINPSEIGTDDLKPFLRNYVNPQLLPSSLTISGTFSGDKDGIQIAQMALSSKDGELKLQGNGYANQLNTTPKWYANIRQLSVNSRLLKEFVPSAPAQIASLGKVNYQGEISNRDGNSLALNGILQTDIGKTNADLKLRGNLLSAKISTDGINLRELLNDQRLGTLATQMNIEGDLKRNDFKLKGDVSRFDYEGNTYKNIDIDGVYNNQAFAGKFSINDENGSASMDGTIDFSSKIPEANLTAKVHQFNAAILRLDKKWNSAKVSFDTKINLQGKSLNKLTGRVELNNFTLQSPEEQYQMEQLIIESLSERGNQNIDIHGDFGNIQIVGDYDYSTLAHSITNAIKDKLPTLPGLPATKNIRPNQLSLNANITKTDWLKAFFDIDLQLKRPMTINASVNDEKKAVDLTCILPEFTYNDNQYNQTEIVLKTVDDTLKLDGSTKKLMSNGNFFDFAISAKAAENNTKADFILDNHDELRHLKGVISTETQFFRNEQGQPAAHTIIHPSQLSVNEATWNVEPSDIVYSDKHLIIDHFAIQNGEQHVIVSGIATTEIQDTVNIDLKNVDIGFFSDILNVDDVFFGGSASGKATLASVFANTTANAALSIEDFTFVDGRLGALRATADWNKTDNTINIHGVADDGPLGQTLINGDIALTPEILTLNCDLNNTRIEFLENYLKGVMHKMDARATGSLRIFGPLKNINIEGEVVANGDVGIEPLNTTYTLHNDTIRLLPDHLIFRADSVFDKNKHLAVVNGDIYHTCLKNWIYDLNIEADNVLAFDVKDFGDDSFCGTVYATGTCHISNQTNEVVLDIEATPQENSIIKYNADSPNAVKKQEFIHWHDVTEKNPLFYKPLEIAIAKEETETTTTSQNISIPTNLHINFLINTTPDLTLRLIMNEESGDYIDLHGNGVLRATYFNKGSFDIFGNYIIDHGVYKMTIQNIIKKDFEFQEGGTIVFGGDPYEATLNLQAAHTINGVSLSDLNIGRSFSSNNIRVNCLMNITGTPSAPKADFDLQLPTVSSDAQQMVRSLINSEEELNQQVIYLLTIGRFYTQGANNANQDGTSPSQASLAMQSLLSGTLSQQINTVLGSVVNNSNWNFGANISTGTEGWNNAEYEGILSGRLLNNRLLINGQFGYRDNPNATTSFIGDFDIRYLLFPNGNLAVKVYNQTNDRYFTRSSLNTQGIGLIIKKDFNNFRDLFGRKKKKTSQAAPDSIPAMPADSLKQE